MLSGNEPERLTIGVVAWGDQHTSLFKGSEIGGGVSPADVAKRRDIVDATFTPDASDRCTVSRTADRR